MGKLVKLSNETMEFLDSFRLIKNQETISYSQIILFLKKERTNKSKEPFLSQQERLEVQEMIDESIERAKRGSY